MSNSAPDPGTESGRVEPPPGGDGRPAPAGASAGGAAGGAGPDGFDPFRFGRPEPDSPAAAAFPHLFPPQPQQPSGPGLGSGPGWGPGSAPGPGQANPNWAPPAHQGWVPPAGPSYPPPASGTGLGYPPPYGPAYPTGYPPAGGDRPGNGKAVAGLVLGIVSVVLFFFTLFDLIPIVLAFVFSIQGLRASRRGRGQRGLAVAGLVLASIATVIVVVFVTFFAIRVNHCQQHHDQGTKSYNQCLIDL